MRSNRKGQVLTQRRESESEPASGSGPWSTTRLRMASYLKGTSFCRSWPLDWLHPRFVATLVKISCPQRTK